ncbi:tail fiber protein [Luteibacter anthropi]|uniref:phage tail protein n=1 Tax=Luteibacter anthropi TaxID=564369 RepID=UPI002032581E|nr:tail fiber protein [Luteibacter anthropi]URX62915.1 tail fiber protein [Luteibacter anthropi]
MTEPFVGEVQLFAFNFAPTGWALCSGALIAVQQNPTLFSLLGTNYGGNGTTTFGLPNFGGNAACSLGQGTGLSNRVIGEVFGSEGVTLLSSNIPPHTHGMAGYAQPDPSKRSSSPTTGVGLCAAVHGASFLNSTAPPAPPTPNTTFSPVMLNPGTAAGPHENRQPYLTVNFCIALNGVFPTTQ